SKARPAQEQKLPERVRFRFQPTNLERGTAFASQSIRKGSPMLIFGPPRQLDDGKPRKTEDDIQQELLGPRGVPGRPSPAKMTPQRAKKTPAHADPPHPA